MMGSLQMAHQPCQKTNLEEELIEIAELPRPELVARWRRLYRNDPPKGISKSLLLSAIAYKIQAKHSGGLSLAVNRRLKRMAEAPDGPTPVKTSPRGRLAPGTRLIREWNGTTHVVEVLDGGFIWNGVRHGSLSAVAQAITGARWSGPRFFNVARGGGP